MSAAVNQGSAAKAAPTAEDVLTRIYELFGDTHDVEAIWNAAEQGNDRAKVILSGLSWRATRDLAMEDVAANLWKPKAPTPAANLRRKFGSAKRKKGGAG